MANNIYEEYALGSVLSDSAGLDYDVVVDSLRNGDMPDEVIVWQPFEYEDMRGLAERIEEYHDIFKTFAEELDERRAQGIEQ